MSSMTQKANSDCPYPESDYDDVKSQISRVHEQLMAVLQQEMELRQSLEELFDKQEAEALEELRKAEENLMLIRKEREAMKSQLKDKGSKAENHKTERLAQDSVDDTESLETPLEPNPVSTALTGNQQSTSDQEQDSLLPVEDPETQAVILKYKGNKTALELHAELKEYELEAEGFRRQVQETEPIARRWKEIMDKYSRTGGANWRFADNKYDDTKHEQYKSKMKRAEKNAAIIREILTNFE